MGFEQFGTIKGKLQQMNQSKQLQDVASKLTIAGVAGHKLLWSTLQAIEGLDGEIRSGRRVQIDYHEYETVLKRWLIPEELDKVHQGFLNDDRALIQTTLVDALNRWLAIAQQVIILIETAGHLRLVLLEQLAAKAQN